VSETPWQVILQRQAQRQLRKLPKDVLKRIAAALDRISEDPYVGDPLQGFEYRKWRVGEWRIIYLIEDDKLIILVVDLDHRREIYRRLNQ
jgi:mRNA interferase RelE/StbE